jgi:hypothetical protein
MALVVDEGGVALQRVAVGAESVAVNPQRGQRTQYWCFTFTNLEGPPDLDLPEDPELYRAFRLQPATLEELELWKYQPEVGSGDEDQMDGLLHIQGFVKTKRKGLRYAQLTRMFGLESYQVHWEPARNFAAAWDYCGKEDTRLVGGTAIGYCSPAFFDVYILPGLLRKMRGLGLI